MTIATKTSKSWIAGIFTAIAASLCCITPVLALLGSAGGLASSFSWMEPFRPYLIGLTVLVFAFVWYQKLKREKEPDCDCKTGDKKSFWQSKTFLSIVTIIAALLISFPYYANIFYPKPQKIKVMAVDKSNIQQAVFTINGMTCESCTEHINGKVAKVNGVIAYKTSYENATCTVRFDNSKTSIDSLVAAINSTGYKIVSQTVTGK